MDKTKTSWLMLTRPQISEVAVVGVHSEQWGQKVAAVVVLDAEHAQSGKAGKTWGAMDMRRALKDRLVNYKIPQEMKVVEGGLPRNAMGKSNVPTLSDEPWSMRLTVIQLTRRSSSSRFSETRLLERRDGTLGHTRKHGWNAAWDGQSAGVGYYRCLIRRTASR